MHAEGCHQSTFEKFAMGDEGQVSKPAFQAIEDMRGVHNSSSPHFTLLPEVYTEQN